MVSNQRPEPNRDRGNLADVNWADVYLPDDDLWLLLAGQSTPPQLEAGDKISPEWVAWAKETILDVSFIPAPSRRNDEGLGREDALAIYLCRLMRIVDLMADSPRPVAKPSVDLENLLLSAAHVGGVDIDLRRLEGGGEGVDDVLRRACEAGLVQAVEAVGGARLYGLTLLGRRKADGGGMPPPYRWSVQRELDAARADVEVASQTYPPPPTADRLPEARSGGRPGPCDVSGERGASEVRPSRDAAPTGPESARAGGSADGGMDDVQVGEGPVGAGSGTGDAGAPAPANRRSAEEIDPLIGCMPVPDPVDTRKVRWFGELLYLGSSDGQVARLFWLLTRRFGRSCRLATIQREIDGCETSVDVGSPADEINKSKQRIRSLVAILRGRLRERGHSQHVVILCEAPKTDPAYTMTFRPDLEQ